MRNGRTPRPESIRAKEMLKDGLSPKEIMSELPMVCGATISHLTKKLGLPKWKSGKTAGCSQLAKARLAIIKHGTSIGKSQANISRELGITPQQVSELIYPERASARSAVNMAIKRGKLIKPSLCEKCLKPFHKLEGHHEDYNKKLEVKWLCTPCHKQLS